MIKLNDVSTKLQNILNGNDGETESITRPTDFLFMVETQGFHLDHIYDKDAKRNVIPVFVGSMGGSINPVPNLQQANYSIPIVFYFPVRFKDDFFALNDYLAQVFVGRILTYGNSGKAVSNISIAQYGEIQDVDFKEFKSWAESLYPLEINVMEPYMSMTVNLYLSSMASGFLYGNEVTAKLSATIDGVTYTDQELVFDDSSLQSNSQAQSEQELGTNEAVSVPFGTALGISFSVYYQSTDFFKHIIKKFFDGESQELVFNLKASLGDEKIVLNNVTYPLEYSRTCFIQSINMPIRKGQPITLTFTFAKLSEEVLDDDDEPQTQVEEPSVEEEEVING